MNHALKTLTFIISCSFCSAFAADTKNPNFTVTVPKEDLFASVAEILDVSKSTDLTNFTLRTTSAADSKNIVITLTASEDNSEKIVGNYVCHLYFPNPNDWHFVTISSMGDGTLKWSNRAGKSWRLTPTGNPDIYSLGSDCPYYEAGRTTVVVLWDENRQNVRSIFYTCEAYDRATTSEEKVPKGTHTLNDVHQ